MKFILIIGRKALYTFERNGQNFEPQYIEGSEEFPISSLNMCEDVEEYMNLLADEKNFETTAMLEFCVIESYDQKLNVMIKDMLGERVSEAYSFNEMIVSVIGKLIRDKKLMVDKYGINYDGYSYNLNNNKICRGNFDLLAYTIHSRDVVELIDINQR